MKYSLVISSFNASGYIIPFFKRVNEKFNLKEFELIIVNNESIDTSQGLLKVCLKKYKCLKVKTFANNIGYGNSIYEVLKCSNDFKEKLRFIRKKIIFFLKLKFRKNI